MVDHLQYQSPRRQTGLFQKTKEVPLTDQMQDNLQGFQY